MTTPHDEYLGKLRKMAEGALNSIDRRAQEDPKRDSDRQKSWWQGYRQALDDVDAFVANNPTREEIP